MSNLILTNKDVMYDYILRYLAKQAKQMDLEYWVAFFVDKIIIRNNAILADIQKSLGCSDMVKMYNTLKNAEL